MGEAEKLLRGLLLLPKPYRTVVHVNPKLLPGNEIFGHDMHHQTFINAFSFCNARSEAWKAAEEKAVAPLGSVVLLLKNISDITFWGVEPYPIL